MNKSTAYIIGAVVVLALVGTYIEASYIADKNSDRITLQTNREVDKETQQKYGNTCQPPPLTNTLSRSLSRAA